MLYFYRVKLCVQAYDSDHPHGAQRFIAAHCADTAIGMAMYDLDDGGYDTIEVVSCEEVYPSAAIVSRVYFDRT